MTNNNTNDFSRKNKKCNLGDIDQTPLSEDTLKRLEEAREDCKKGKLCTLKQLKSEFGLE
ncbi:hypothetical protein [Methanosalsum natronophilum]|uniref:Uncharacterized protein n=1 Tax=Methanosalsum natronophilum TaxID=768733 RepID=A0A3R7WER0_9EURY|nr:hypothetical protein [Methanosalsum natronophilum]MCS3924544.1 hypothetical protein [Methanosalsum natronophilum]RQD85678.1 MAG: hypothetical protein D5R95_04375 [Methanosalsum natronophilum]